MVHITKSISFGSHERLKLDIYRPRIGENLPVIVFFYGGSWKDGNRGLYRLLGAELAKEGFLTIIPDYRLFPDVQFPAFNHDAASALKWIEENAADFGGQNGHLTLMGHSAGAHISASLLLVPRYLQEVGISVETITGFVGLAGPFTLNPKKYDSVRDVFETAGSEEETRPVKHVADAPHLPRTLLLHGNRDRTVYVENMLYMANAFRDRGADVETVLYPRLGHIGILTALMPLIRRRASVWEDLIRFLKCAAA